MDQNETLQMFASFQRRKQAEAVLAGCHVRKPQRSKAGRTVASLKGRPKSYEKSHFSWKSCARKKRFTDQGTATWHLHRWEQMTGKKGKVYWCSFCNGWHHSFSEVRQSAKTS